MKTYHFLIPGPPITKKNSMRVFRLKNGRTIVKPSAAYEAYEATASYFVLEDKPDEPIDYPVTVTVTYYMKARRPVDLTNLLEATDDILVKCGVLKDDNRDIIASHDGSRVLYDKENPRCIIAIKPYGNYEQWKKREP